MNKTIFDVEANGLLDEATRIHCLTFGRKYGDTFGKVTLTDYEDMRAFLSEPQILIGHNIIRYDIPVLEKLLDIKIPKETKLVDTLALSWYLYPNRKLHGLESWGEDFGVPKPEVVDWENESIEVYKNRCEEDVEINKRLFNKQYQDLWELYDGKIDKIIKYLMFKVECVRLQEESKWKLDIDRCKRGLEKLERLKKEKEAELIIAMPEVPVKRKVKRPDKIYRKNGTLSVAGANWFSLLSDRGLPDNHRDTIEVVRAYNAPKPTSVPQVKEWLFSMGWEPETFKYVKEGDGLRKIPQIKQQFGVGLCPSVKKLQDKEPAIGALEGLTVIQHRIGLLKGFLSDQVDGYLQATVAGFTNTLRFRHKELVNLPSTSAPYAEDVRGSLVCPEGYELCGSDMSSLEDRTKQHYMWPHDPEYVKEMMVDDFDPHLSLAEFAGALTPEQVRAHKEGTEDHKQVRHIYKTANYACTYGAGGPTVARGAGISAKEGKAVVSAYRRKNWAIDTIAKGCRVKKTSTGKWLWNPVSQLYYYLKADKDKFSTLNQGTGVYCFDTWLKYILSQRGQLTGQFHDEVILTIKKGRRKQCEDLLRWAIDMTNKELKLNRELDIEVQFGNNYGEIH